MLSSETMLAFYDPNKKCLLVVTDVCGEPIGGILLQLDEHNHEKPVAYIPQPNQKL